MHHSIGKYYNYYNVDNIKYVTTTHRPPTHTNFIRGNFLLKKISLARDIPLIHNFDFHHTIQ